MLGEPLNQGWQLISQDLERLRPCPSGRGSKEDLVFKQISVVFFSPRCLALCSLARSQPP